MEEINLFIVKKKDMSNLTKYQQLKKYGYWDMKFDKSFFPNSYIFKKGELYYFSGIIASLRCLTDVTILSIGVGEGKYEILSHIKPFNFNIGLKGSLIKRNDTFHTLKIQYF